MNRMLPKRSLIALVLALVLVLGSVPAYGTTTPTAAPAAVVEAGPVPSHALVGERDLFGLTEAAARAAITTGTVMPAFKSLTAKGDGHAVTLVSKNAILLNTDLMLRRAYAATEGAAPFALTPAYMIKPGIVASWTSAIAKRINHKAISAKRRVKGRSLVVSKEVIGHTVNRGYTGARIRAALYAEIASPTATPKVVPASLKSIKPKVTRKNIDKAILVVLSKFSVKLYKGTKVEKSYKCATGMRGFATPTGKWKVIRKVKNPSWHNPGSGWANGMPSVIGPGPSNPLGTRAIYLNAPGIRIHGTSKSWSIGTRASHGCMRMKRRDIENLYPRVPVGITVWIIK